MSLLDLLIVASATSAIIGGFRLGFVARITSWAGLALGLVLGAAFLPNVAGYFVEADPQVRVVAAVAFLLAAAMLGQGLGLAIGAALHATLRVGPGFRQYDRAAGAVFGGLGVLAIFWLLAPALVAVPGWTSRAARESAVLELLAENLPQPPDTLHTLRRILGEGGFPEVFEAFGRTPEIPDPPDSVPIDAAVHQRVVDATVKVTGQACRKVQEGSGFAAGPDLIVTNAHVVAGENETRVETSDGRRLDAEAVLFDADRDLAVLRVPGLDEQPLETAVASEGDLGIVYGHPGGGDLRPAPAQVSQRVTANGRDIYDQHRTQRDVFILAAGLRPGDSGGALVNQAGQVVGVAFAIAPDRSDVAYALTDEELRPALAAVGSQPVDTGPCLV